MKKLILILICLSTLTVAAQNKIDEPINKKMEKALQLGVDTLNDMEIVYKVVEQDSTIAAAHDTIQVLKEKAHIIDKEARDKYLWANTDPASYLWGLFYALIGILINTVFITRKAIKKNDKTPKQFSIQYWWNDNKDRLLRWVGILAVIFIAMRFSNEIFSKELTMFFAFLLGLCLDVVIEKIKNLKIGGINGNTDTN